jgi:hypothetical protein
MKSFIISLSLILSINAFATIDYTCRVRNYQIDLEIDNETDGSSTFAQMRDLFNYQILFFDYVKFTETMGDKTLYHFYPSQNNVQKVLLTFRTEDIKNQERYLPGFIDLSMGVSGTIYDIVDCRKKF